LLAGQAGYVTYVDTALECAKLLGDIAGKIDSNQRAEALQLFNDRASARAATYIEKGELKVRPTGLLSALSIQAAKRLLPTTRTNAVKVQAARVGSK
jgi:hypothetical protein